MGKFPNIFSQSGLPPELRAGTSPDPPDASPCSAARQRSEGARPAPHPAPAEPRHHRLRLRGREEAGSVLTLHRFSLPLLYNPAQACVSKALLARLCQERRHPNRASAPAAVLGRGPRQAAAAILGGAPGRMTPPSWEGTRQRHLGEVGPACPRERRSRFLGGGRRGGIGIGALRLRSGETPLLLQHSAASRHHFRVSGGDLRPLTRATSFPAAAAGGDVQVSVGLRRIRRHPPARASSRHPRPPPASSGPGLCGAARPARGRRARRSGALGRGRAGGWCSRVTGPGAGAPDRGWRNEEAGPRGRPAALCSAEAAGWPTPGPGGVSLLPPAGPCAAGAVSSAVSGEYRRAAGSLRRGRYRHYSARGSAFALSVVSVSLGFVGPSWGR